MNDFLDDSERTSDENEVTDGWKGVVDERVKVYDSMYIKPKIGKSPTFQMIFKNRQKTPLLNW